MLTCVNDPEANRGAEPIHLERQRLMFDFDRTRDHIVITYGEELIEIILEQTGRSSETCVETA